MKISELKTELEADLSSFESELSAAETAEEIDDIITELDQWLQNATEGLSLQDLTAALLPQITKEAKRLRQQATQTLNKKQRQSRFNNLEVEPDQPVLEAFSEQNPPPNLEPSSESPTPEHTQKQESLSASTGAQTGPDQAPLSENSQTGTPDKNEKASENQKQQDQQPPPKRRKI